MTHIRVLVVHSEPSDLAVLASVAAANAFELRVVEPPADLVREVVRFQPDAVVLDVLQRSGDGYELCALLKAAPETSPVPAILIGAVDGPEAQRLAFAAGCDDFLEKPINRHLLAYRLRSFARLRRAWVRERERAPAGDTLLQMCRGFAAFLGYASHELAALERAFRVVEVFETTARTHPLASAIAELREDTSLDPALVAAFATWLLGSEEQPHEVEP